jgi:Rad3-related DNA helicase
MEILASKFKTTWAFQALMLDIHDGDNKDPISLINVIAHSLWQDESDKYKDIINRFPSFSKSVVSKYSEYFNIASNNPESINLHSFNMFSWMIPGCVNYFERVQTDGTKTDDVHFSRHIVTLAEMLKKMKEGIETLIQVKNRVGDKEYPTFVSSADKECHFRSSYEGVDGLERLAVKYFGLACKDKFDHVMLTPVVTASFLHRFFYSCAEHVVLSTGTWVHLGSSRTVYGIHESDSEYIRIPTTFPKTNRPIFVISDRGKTNFSDKTEEGAFVYKTPAGTNKFCDELSSVLKTARERIYSKTKTNVNAIVHCHTFDIARRIAEYLPGVDDKYLIHIGPHDREIINVDTKQITCPRHKDDLVQQFIDHPDSGLTLVSASVSEGVDFKDGIARLQVLLKKPIPYLGDPYVSVRFRGDPSVGLERDPMFMDRVIFTEMIQQYGRIMRSQTDWGITIVFDQASAKSLWYMLKPGSKTILNLDYFLQGIRGGIKNGKVYFDEF